ncbi:E3 ubiquitin-protein ligase TRIM56-like [Ptychodera flava]|uniref:E3 ubiquitin-protein ligase TRIM56-like n=1 Tax=Ptychodera flava TaxID=63121 RepID=UPI00396A9642
MAGTGKQSPSPDEIDDNFLLCGICSERYRNAKLLLCLHSFCKPCLDKLSEKSGAITCPVCRRSHDLPGDGVAGIPNNDFLNDLVKRRSEQEQQKCDDLKKCGACEEGEVSNHCLDCSFDICDNCTKAHAKIRSTQSHRLVALDEYAALTAKCGDPCSFQTTVYCVTHPDHRIEFYCSTCDQVICSKCAALDHLKPVHQYMFIKDASQDFTGHLSVVIDKVKVKDVEIQDSKVAIQGTLESLDRCYQREDENVQGHIRDTIEKITRLVEESGNKVQAELKSECEKRKTNLRAQLKELDIAEDDLTGAREFLETLANHGNSLQLMSVKKRVFDQTETLLQTETRVDPAADDFMAFQACDDFCRDEKIGTMMFRKQECNQVDVAPLTEDATPADIPADNVKYEENEKTLLITQRHNA